MLSDGYQNMTNNKSDIILTLVADSARASEVWAEPVNASRYLEHPPIPIDHEPSPKNPVREGTPPFDTRGPKKEPGLQLTFTNTPKNPELGYLLGRDKEVCDVYLGSRMDGISGSMFSISFNEYNEVILKSLAGDKTKVRYSIDGPSGEQEVERNIFTWILLPEVQKIHVSVPKQIEFWVVMPKHGTDQAAYEANCQNFKKLAHSATRTLASGAVTPQTSAEEPFHLRTAQIGDGAYGVVYKGRSMPDGRTVAIKTFKSGNEMAQELKVLKTFAKEAHDNLVEFINFDEGEIPQLILGLAAEGNLAEQHKLKRFTIREVGLILRQMLDAVGFLHVGFNITHRDIKPQNILCDSRTQSRTSFQLTDFGLAKKGNKLRTFKGTQPYMAPEMFTNRPYTAAVDIWSLGMVVARYLAGGRPKGYTGEEGEKYCAAVVAHFEKYRERSAAAGVENPERRELNNIVGQHMLRIKPKERETAPNCIRQGGSLWSIIDNDSIPPPRESKAGVFTNVSPLNDGKGLSKIIEEKEPGVENDGLPEGMIDEISGDDGSVEGCDSETEREFPPNENKEDSSLDSEDWLALERDFPPDENKGTLSVPRQFLEADFENESEHSTTPSDSEGSTGSQPSPRNEEDTPVLPCLLDKNPAAAPGVQKRKWSSQSG